MDSPPPPESRPPRPAAATPAEGRGVLKRVLGLTAVLAAIVALSFVVGRLRINRESLAVNYQAMRGPRPPGLKIFLQRGQDLTVLDPSAELRDGDQLRFVVRASAPRYLVLRARDGAGRNRLLFPGPDATTAAPVQPDQTLPGVLPIDATPGKETVTALFGEHAFPLGAPPSDDIQVVTVVLKKTP
jgi:hypothetical protein